MELKFKSSGLHCLRRAVCGQCAAELTQEVRLTDGMPDIGRILGSWGQVIVRSKEWRSDEITVSGGVMIWILYAPEEGTQPRCMDAWMPFELRWDNKESEGEGPIRVCPVLRSVESRSVSARKLMVKATVSAMCEALYPADAQLFEPENLPEDVQLLKRTYPIRIPKEAGEKTFLLDEDLTLEQNAPAVERLLCYRITPRLKELRVAGDKLILRGSGELQLLYRSPEGKIHGRNFEVPFSQYAQLDNPGGSDALTDVSCAVTALELHCADNHRLQLKCGMVAQYLICERQIVALTEDAYSPVRRVDVKCDAVKIPSVAELKTETVAASQQLSGIEGEIVDVTFLPDHPQCSRSDRKLDMKLPGRFQVLYYGSDGSIQSVQARWEGSLTLPADEHAQITAFTRPHSGSQAISKGEELELSAHYDVQIQTVTVQEQEIVAGMEVGDPEVKDPARPSLILRRTDGEDLWSLAKRCGSTVDAICSANGITGEPDENLLLLIPVC